MKYESNCCRNVSEKEDKKKSIIMKKVKSK